MSVMSVAILSPGAISSRRALPRLLVRGKNRKLVRALVAKLHAVQNMDDREIQRAFDADYFPYLFGEGSGGTISKAMNKVLARAEEMLIERG